MTSTLSPDAAAVDIDSAVARAARLLDDSLAGASSDERRRQQRLAAVVDDAALRELTFALTDEVLRFDDPRRAAARFKAVVDDVGVPASLGAGDRVLLRVGARLAPVAPRLVMPLVRSRIVAESNGVVLPADDPGFARHVARRAGERFRVNVNVLGEAILSDAEADERLAMVLGRVARTDVSYVSLKISSVVANLDVLAFEHSVERVCERLRVLYRAAARGATPTFVNLDMEEYRDLPLTLASLTTVLDEPEFAAIDAGVVLQAYLPDSHGACDELGEWAAARHRRSGGTLKIRVVKGANLAMERVEAELHGWEQAPYPSKAAVDASFKRLVLRALDSRWSGAVRVGLASHNLFDVAWAMGLPAHLRERIEFEMLEGMAPSQARAVNARVGDVLLYAPVVRHDDMAASIAYLSRRLDENTAPENFLRALFTLRPGSDEWDEQEARFRRAVIESSSVDTTPRRQQDRGLDIVATRLDRFENAADTDWTRQSNREWLATAMAHTVVSPVRQIDSTDEVDDAVERARSAALSWASTPFAERRRVLANVAAEMERSRGRTLALMALTACKTVAEGDPEVSEAVDFARFYGWCTHGIEERVSRGRAFVPHGVVVVASPWNFPYAIPAGGVLAALAAGNAVILKPAPEVREVARELVDQLWRAGVPRDVVQFAPAGDNDAGRRLVTHDDVDAVVLTGSYETAQMFLSWKPSLRLMAETSGKNAMVITAAADEDAAIRDLVRSAFGHAGQKCSAASLAIIEAPLHDDGRFLRRLADAVRSVRVGPSTDPASMMGPIVGTPSEKLRRALTLLDAGERWLVEPRCVDELGNLWSPGVRIGVRRGSWFHQTEAFGPVLGVMRADDLEDAIAMQNDVAYGLTGGIHSLDEHEVDHWLDRVEVGNAYVNRHTTGAVVQRQPFGGWKRSSVGGAPKAGGPFYVEAFGTWSGGDDGEAEFGAAWRGYFSAEHDPSRLAAERNVLRYRPLPSVGLFVAADAPQASVDIARLAASVAGASPVDVVAGLPDGLVRGMAPPVERVRVIGTVGDEQLREWFGAGIDVDRVQPVADAVVELRRWVREQAVSTTRHRHGRLLG